MPQIEPQDTDHQFVEAMVKEVAALPPQPVEPQPKEIKRFKRVVDERPVKKKSDAAIALDRLAGAAKRATDKFSLAEWRETDDLAKTLQPHIWLGFAVLALREQKYRVEVVSSPARPGERFRHRFHDAMVHPASVAGTAKA